MCIKLKKFHAYFPSDYRESTGTAGSSGLEKEVLYKQEVTSPHHPVPTVGGGLAWTHRAHSYLSYTSAFIIYEMEPDDFSKSCRGFFYSWIRSLFYFPIFLVYKKTERLIIFSNAQASPLKLAIFKVCCFYCYCMRTSLTLSCCNCRSNLFCWLYNHSTFGNVYIKKVLQIINVLLLVLLQKLLSPSQRSSLILSTVMRLNITWHLLLSGLPCLVREAWTWNPSLPLPPPPLPQRNATTAPPSSSTSTSTSSSSLQPSLWCLPRAVAACHSTPTITWSPSSSPSLGKRSRVLPHRRSHLFALCMYFWIYLMLTLWFQKVAQTKWELVMVEIQ